MWSGAPRTTYPVLSSFLFYVTLCHRNVILRVMVPTTPAFFKRSTSFSLISCVEVSSNYILAICYSIAMPKASSLIHGTNTLFINFLRWKEQGRWVVSFHLIVDQGFSHVDRKNIVKALNYRSLVWFLTQRDSNAEHVSMSWRYAVHNNENSHISHYKPLCRETLSFISSHRWLILWKWLFWCFSFV